MKQLIYAIEELMTKKNRDFLSFDEVCRYLPLSVLKQYGLGRRVDIKKMTEIIGSYFVIQQNGKKYFICTYNLEEIIVRQILRLGDKATFNNLGKHLILIEKDKFQTIINDLLKRNVITCLFTSKQNAVLVVNHKDSKRSQERSQERSNDINRSQDSLQQQPLDKGQAKSPAIQHPPDSFYLETDFNLFKEAYHTIGKGRNFIRIHRLREYLNWPDQKFETVLKKLMSDYTIELHGGDPSTMTEKEIGNSFTDDNGILYLTVSFRGLK